MNNLFIVKANLLYFYNTASDTLETDNSAFPADVLAKIESFGHCKLEAIDDREAHFIRLV